MHRMRGIALCMTTLAVPGFAQIVSYDGAAFPEETGDGWTRDEQVNLAERSLEDGWLIQAPVVLPCPPHCWTQDFYRRDLDDQADGDSWFLEWVVLTTGPQAFGAVAPASIVGGGTSGVLYHFTIARDRMSFKRGSQFLIVFADIEEGVAHRYRLELQNTAPTGTYRFTINGEVIDDGPAEAFYPTGDSSITFGARAAIEDSVTKWDNVRFGRIPDSGSGDMTGDGLTDHADFPFFAECHSEGGPGTEARAGCLFADMDLDSDVDFHDLALFQLAYTGGE